MVECCLWMHRRGGEEAQVCDGAAVSERF